MCKTLYCTYPCTGEMGSCEDHNRKVEKPLEKKKGTALYLILSCTFVAFVCFSIERPKGRRALKMGSKRECPNCMSSHFAGVRPVHVIRERKIFKKS